MLTFEIEGRKAIPVRALAFVTEGTFSAEDIVELFYDPEAHADVQSPAPPASFVLSAERVVTAQSPTLWKRVREKLHAPSPNVSDPLVQIGKLPTGVFVWLDEFKSLYIFLTSMAAGAEAKGFRSPPAGEWGWNEGPHVSAEEHALIWEGFETEKFGVSLQPNPEPTSSQATARLGAAVAKEKPRLTDKGIDLELNERASKLAEKLRGRDGMWPSRNAVARELSAEVGLPEVTVKRRIRKTW